MESLEIAVFYGQLQDMAAAGMSRAASHSRHDLCMIVKEVWQAIDHEAIRHKGYQQTGPELPLEGPIYMNDLCIDLRDVVKDLCPHDDPQQVGTEIRDEAEELVERMWRKQVHCWNDYHVIVEDHADHRAQAEGEEAMPFEVENDSGGDDASDDDEDYSSSSGESDDDDDDDSDSSDSGSSDSAAATKRKRIV